jgi:hypothetical protein
VSRDSSTSRLDAAVVAQIKANADLSAIGDNDVKIEASLLSKLCEMLLEPPYTVSESGLNQSHERTTQAASDSQRQSEGNGRTAGGSPAPEAGGSYRVPTKLNHSAGSAYMRGFTAGWNDCVDQMLSSDRGNA